MSKRTASHQRKSFTLIELLVVIAIIAILAAMLLPSLNKARATARKSACVNNYKSIGVAMNMYVDDHNGFYPMSCTITTLRTIWSSDNPRIPVTFIAPYLKHTRETSVGYVRINNPSATKDNTSSSPLACPAFDRTRWVSLPTTSFPSYLSNSYIFDQAAIGMDSKKYRKNLKNPFRPSRVMMSMDSTGANNGILKVDADHLDRVAYRHNNMVNVLFLDGHVTSLKLGNVPHGYASCPGYIKNAGYSYFWRGRNEASTFDVKTY